MTKIWKIFGLTSDKIAQLPQNLCVFYALRQFQVVAGQCECVYEIYANYQIYSSFIFIELRMIYFSSISSLSGFVAKKRGFSLCLGHICVFD